MQVNYIDLNNTENNIDSVYQFLKNNGVTCVFPVVGDNEYNRELSFKINENWNTIIWFKNESTLWLGEKNKSPTYKFRYIYIDTTYPLIGGNNSIGFSYTKNKVESVFDPLFPYDVLRIPFK